MPVRFVVVPQWQGSPSSRAMRLVDGALALREDLPSASTREVAVPLEAGDAQDSGIPRFSSLEVVRERLTDALARADDPAIVLGGDCAVSDAAIAYAATRVPRLAVVWFDAHPDLNTPESSPSGAYAGMVLRSVLERGDVAPERLVLAGTRSWDDEEERVVAERGIRVLGVEALADAEALGALLAGMDADAVYLHIDLDVLDPAEIGGLLAPQPFGVAAGDLVAAIRAALGVLPLAGATLASFAPDSAQTRVDDAPTLLRIIGALARPAGSPAAAG